jgi:hypothetical protein
MTNDGFHQSIRQIERWNFSRPSVKDSRSMMWSVCTQQAVDTLDKLQLDLIQ